MERYLISLTHTQRAGIAAFSQLPVPGCVLFVMGKNVFAFHFFILFFW